MDIKPVEITAECLTCQKQFTGMSIQMGERTMLAQRYCPACLEEMEKAEDERKRQEEHERLIARSRDRFEALVRPEYRKLDEALLPAPAALAAAMAWRYGTRGLMLIGKSGTAKTRIAMQVVKREIWRGRSIEIYTSGVLCRHMADAATNGTSTKLLNRLCNVQLLVLDDFGQGAKTEAADELTWEVVEARTSGHKPMLITTQYKAEKLVGRFLTEERGHAIVRRLSQYCDRVDFDELLLNPKHRRANLPSEKKGT